MASKTFLRITNKDIYDKLVGLEKNHAKLYTVTKVNSAVIGLIIIILVGIIKTLI